MKAQFMPYKDDNPSKSFPIVTISLIAVNVIVFIWSLTNFDNTIATYGFVPANFVLLTIFTSMFLHGGIDHIFGNMLFLHIFGDNVEDKLGKVKYLIFYLLAGLSAALVHFLTGPSSTIPTIGASGAISGVLGAYIVFFPRVRVRTFSFGFSGSVPAYIMIGLWFLMQLVFGSVSLIGGTGSGIAFWAHVGGFAFGFLVALVYRKFS